jgi:hypothetical protein
MKIEVPHHHQQVAKHRKSPSRPPLQDKSEGEVERLFITKLRESVVDLLTVITIAII